MTLPNTPTIAPRVFYKNSPPPAKFAKVETSRPLFDVEIPPWLRSLVDGPTTLWKVFKKQNDALQFSKVHGEGLMTFAFQERDGTRRFLSAHPVMFWFYDNNRKLPEDRRTYEVITEGAVCKLYFDLEFEKEFNHGHDGVKMTDTFIKLVSYFLRHEFGVTCDRSNVLDLDSTTASKFSRHLLFQIPKTYFRDNYNVGYFVKMICVKLQMMIRSPATLQEFSSQCDLTAADVENLFVIDKHGAKKIFCDEAVYTKNRHFRLYKSTKWKKNSHLVLSAENLYKPSTAGKEMLAEQQLFLDSLISYIDNSAHDIMILEYGPQEQKVYTVEAPSKLPECPVVREEGMSSPQPVLDRFIRKLVDPGYIRRSKYSSASAKIVYEISGNYRFCHNVGRHHKSNNIYIVVDLESFVYYQKCHDPDCSGYRSKDESLPPELVFMLENEGDAVFESVSMLSDEELQDVWQAVTAATSAEVQDFEDGNTSPGLFPEFGMPDSELLDSTSLLDESALL